MAAAGVEDPLELVDALLELEESDEVEVVVVLVEVAAVVLDEPERLSLR
nr:hypothetical protein [Mumia xiangluensis]